MSHNPEDIELPEMPLPPELPPDEASAFDFDAMKSFVNQVTAIEWALAQVENGCPQKYVVHKVKTTGEWEAIQVWLWKDDDNG